MIVFIRDTQFVDGFHHCLAGIVRNIYLLIPSRTKDILQTVTPGIQSDGILVILPAKR
jgi:hypothetical protein